MSNLTVHGPLGVWVNQVKWLASLNTGVTWTGYIGKGDKEGTEWHRLQDALKENGWFVTHLRLQYQGITYHAIPHAKAYACYANFALDPTRPQKSYQEQAVMGSQVGETWYILRLSQDGQVWQEVKRGEDLASVPGQW